MGRRRTPGPLDYDNILLSRKEHAIAFFFLRIEVKF
jgi:hypothetical protein